MAQSSLLPGSARSGVPVFDKREFNQSSSMSAASPARRVRGRFISFGFWTSVVAFVVIEGDALLDQSEIGHASTSFMLGTACLAAAACIALFAIIVATGLAISAAFAIRLTTDRIWAAIQAPLGAVNRAARWGRYVRRA